MSGSGPELQIARAAGRPAARFVPEIADASAVKFAYRAKISLRRDCLLHPFLLILNAPPRVRTCRVATEIIASGVRKG
jgi:hypothetical protein